ncbi:MAG TPA: hypothetical protein VFS47_04150 [Steroidobacteraceae bacterium]|nr:hypothetical protein [Steroidobacteraceae bacterium]
MKRLESVLFLTLALLGTASFAAAHSATQLGSGAAVDEEGHVWVVSTEPAENGNTIVVAALDDSSTPKIRVTQKPEPVSADGENHPKLAFGAKGEMYVSWTSPTSDRYTGDVHFARSLDHGRTWSTPSIVHRDRQLITHRFDSLVVDGKGRVWIAWIDKRDQAAAEKDGRDYAGAAIYYAYSEDQGAHWKGDLKLADHTCECCRIALTKDERGRAVAFWRHVFEHNERDHAFATLEPNRKPAVHRATFDHWSIDACPHHGPGLAIDDRGVKHAVWFSQVNGESRAFYGQLHPDAPPTRVLELPRGAMHPDVAASGNKIAIAWKRFDGKQSMLETRISLDAGQSFKDSRVATTRNESDQPRLIGGPNAIQTVWRRADGVTSFAVDDGPPAITQTTAAGVESSAEQSEVRPFDLSTLGRITQVQRGHSFWLVLWDLDCPYCMKSLANIAKAQERDPTMRVITVATDSADQAAAIKERLSQLGVRSDVYAFGNAAPEALRYAIDPNWMGEKPRAYLYDASGARTTFTGVLREEQLTR